MTSENLTKSLAIAAAMCPEYARYWNNSTVKASVQMDLQTEFPVVMCEAAKLMGLGDSGIDATAQAGFYIYPIGMVCSCLALVILSSKTCTDVTFIYHRAINAAEILWLAFALEYAAYNIVAHQGIRFYGWELFHTVFGNRLDNAFTDFVEMVVTWISVERASAYVPSAFMRINRRKTAFAVNIVLFLVAIALVFPYSLELTVSVSPNGVYGRSYSSFGLSSAFKIYSHVYNATVVVRIALVIVGACATIVVLMTVGRKKRRLAASIGMRSTASENLMKQAKSNQMLCVLQLCESIPLIVRYILVLMVQSLTFGISFDSFVGLTYTDALLLASKFRYNIRIMFARKITEMLSHTLHFVMYCLLSKRMRKVTRSTFNAFRHRGLITSNT